MAGGGVGARFRRMDMHPRVNSEFATRTSAGGAITLIAAFLMAALFLSELRAYVRTDTVNELEVDTSRDVTLRINLDMTFHAMGCGVISLDAMDITGDNHLDVDHTIYKRRLDKQGKPIAEAERHIVGGTDMKDNEAVIGGGEDEGEECGSCYGAESDETRCCNTCDEVREAYRRAGWSFSNADGIKQCVREGFTAKLHAQQGEGCRIWGHIDVNKVAGNFHFAPGKSFNQNGLHVHDLMPFASYDFDTSHTINSLSFGESFPGAVNPLDEEVVTMPATSSTGMFSYFVKVVPTQYEEVTGVMINTNQFSFTRHYKPMANIMSGGVPGVFFYYDLSPIKIKFAEERRSALQFLTSVFAILGGIFTVSSMVDGFVYHGSKAIAKKMELGKFS